MSRLSDWRKRRNDLLHQRAVERQRRAKASRSLTLLEKALKVAARAIRKLSKPPLRIRAYRVAETLVGVMEQGGNNHGPVVEKIIHENGGLTGEPWCGDFVAYCYRHAGSKRVTRAWASVALLRGAVGIHATGSPKEGDLVRYTFDHVGLFVRDLGNGYIETIEGNTGPTGAVSDSSTGGDGVYRKHRPKGLVRDYLHVLG